MGGFLLHFLRFASLLALGHQTDGRLSDLKSLRSKHCFFIVCIILHFHDTVDDLHDLSNLDIL